MEFALILIARRGGSRVYSTALTWALTYQSRSYLLSEAAETVGSMSKETRCIRPAANSRSIQSESSYALSTHLMASFHAGSNTLSFHNTLI
jgi:hypothetical protein